MYLFTSFLLAACREQIKIDYFCRNMNTKQNKKTKTGWLRRHPIAFVVTVSVIVVLLATVGIFCLASHDGEAKWFYLPTTSTNASVRDSLRSSLGNSEGNKVYALWRMQGGDPAVAHGAYKVEPGQSALRTARRMKQGAQTPVRLSFNNIRTLDQLAEKVCSRLECAPDSFKAACAALLPKAGFNSAQFTAAFLPDTYEMYWTAKGSEVVRRLLEYRNRFWTEERREKARRLGLSPVEVAVLASIVEEETNMSDERPVVARLYLNRLARGMKLQADPTVKFAIGDFGLRRIRSNHLAVNSPYNTYQNVGLPPGPIRVVDAKTIDAVLDAPVHDYIYMCAKEDFSGRHNFASGFSEHQNNARRYQAALNARNIK